VAAAAATYYRAARTTRRGFESRVPDSPLQLKTFNFTRNNFSPFRANRLALWAFLTNQWIIETYHLVDDQETEKEHAVPLTGFRRHLRFVSQLPLQCSTIAQALQQL
ncbi:MAG TPA: hypothetical protein VJC05_01245, partial [Candidatus Andersenbacteria bacterium]|nr:hypothetical protein [Candidatus Andersenbacteria bacterium]